jgi:hypothetical protein
MPDIIQIAEGNSLPDFIERLEPLFQGWSRFGLEIACEIAKAEALLAPKEFRQLCRYFGIDYSTGRKLVNVGSSDWIGKHQDQLQAIPWPTLYEITLLNEEQRERFKSECLSDGATAKVTRAEVKRFRVENGACAKLPALSPVGLFVVDKGQIELEELFKFEEELDDIARGLTERYPWIQFVKKGLGDRLGAKIQAGNEKAWKREQTEAVKAARHRLREVVNQSIATMPGANWKTRKDQWLKRTRYSWKEELFDPQLNPNVVLREEFGEEPVQPDLVASYFSKYENPTTSRAHKEALAEYRRNPGRPGR